MIYIFSPTCGFVVGYLAHEPDGSSNVAVWSSECQKALDVQPDPRAREIIATARAAEPGAVILHCEDLADLEALADLEVKSTIIQVIQVHNQ